MGFTGPSRYEVGLRTSMSADELPQVQYPPTPLPPVLTLADRMEGAAISLPAEEISEYDMIDSNWSSGSSFSDSNSDEESILTFDTAESITYVLAAGDEGQCFVFDSDPWYSRPDGELSWRMDPKECFSDYTLVVETEEDGEKETYHVHRSILAFGQRRCDYFSKLFRSSFRENQDAVSHFIFPTDVAAFFPDFLDILYNPEYTKNISTNNVSALRKLSFYFCSYVLSSDITCIIKWAIQEIGNPRFSNCVLRNMAFYIKLLCEEAEIDDTIELRAYTTQRLVMHLTHFGRFYSDDNEKDAFGRPKSTYEINFRKQSRASLSAIINNMSPDLLLSVLMHATASLTNRHRLTKSNSTAPLSYEVLRYLSQTSSVTSWYFERIVVCLLDFLQPRKEGAENLADGVLTCANRLSLSSDFVLTTLENYRNAHMEAWSEIGEDLDDIQYDDEVEHYSVIIEGDLAESEFEKFELPSSMLVADLKAVIYRHIGLLPLLQVVSTSKCTETTHFEVGYQRR